MRMEAEAKLSLAQVRAIALPSRIKILRCLATRRATVTEIAERTSMAKSTALKHLRVLDKHGLIRRNDDGERLWVYYDLTAAGRLVGHMDPIRVLIIACVTLAAGLLLGAALALWEGARVRASQSPWGIPDLGAPPVERPYEIAAAILLAGAGLAAAAAAWSWFSRRRRGSRLSSAAVSSDTDSSP